MRPSPIQTLVSIRYYRDGRPWDTEVLGTPTWNQVEEAIRRMDDFYFPIVVQSPVASVSGDEAFDDENSLHVIGGNGRYAIFQYSGPWRYSNATGSTEEVRLWQSDQGYFCEEHNIADLATTLKLAKVFYETSSFEALEAEMSSWP